MRRLRLTPTESEEQKALMARAQYHEILRHYLFAIPNGGSRHPIEAKRLKAEGVMPGVSDLFLSYPIAPYHGLYIEMKRAKPKGILTDQQIDFLERMQKVGYAIGVAYTAEEAWAICLNYLQQHQTTRHPLTLCA